VTADDINHEGLLAEMKRLRRQVLAQNDMIISRNEKISRVKKILKAESCECLPGTRHQPLCLRCRLFAALA
jgi:hypothetical protein